MSCLCNLFDNEIVWVIIIALILLCFLGNNGVCSCGKNTCGMNSCC